MGEDAIEELGGPLPRKFGRCGIVGIRAVPLEEPVLSIGIPMELDFTPCGAKLSFLPGYTVRADERVRRRQVELECGTGCQKSPARTA